MNIHFRLVLLLFLLKTTLLFPQNTKYWLKREFPHIVAENQLWIGTPKGLYQYHFEEDSWAVYGEHNGLPGNDVKILQWDGEFLWVATSKGLAYGDIKLNKWMSYTSENGIPSHTIFTIAFQEDYVWIGTDKGAARFDKLIQEWEIFTPLDGLPDSVVYDIEVDNDLVYLATANGLTEYDTNFEKWRYYGIKDGIPSDTIRFILQTTDYLWLFTDRGPSRFSKKLHSTLSFTKDSRLKYSNIRDLIVDNEKFWLATKNGVLIYDTGNNLWRDFQEQMNLPNRFVNALSFAQDRRWFITKQGVAVFDEKTKTWQRYDEAHGLSQTQYEAVAIFMGRVFLIHFNTIDYYKPTENRWYIYPLKDISTVDRHKTSYISLDREKGSFVQMKHGVRFGISGTRFTYRNQRSHEYRFDAGDGIYRGEMSQRGDLKGQLSLSRERTINGFYNNTDFSQVLYGVRYKGKKGDIVQEVNWGDVRYEQGKNHLIPSLGVFGSSVRLEAGPKTDRYKRSLVSLKGWSGEKTTAFETDFFTGNFKSSGTTLKDVDYMKNVFFRLDTTSVILPIEEGSERIFVDDGNPNNNTANTLENSVIGGVGGDFDLLHPFLDYILDVQWGKVQFSEPISDMTTIVVQYTSRGSPVERVIKKPDVVNNVMANHYFVGGMEIIPSSFRLEIYDIQGRKHPISEFGLDKDHDSRVDPEWIDYKKGLLSFPDPKPFPLSVYDSESPISHYDLKIQFQTEITIFYLSHKNLIRGSEVVIVDAEMLTRGEDYVLDYTSGTLLILKEGTVAEDSEIEVSYDYYRDSREKFHLAGIEFGPSDNVLMEVNTFGFDQENSDLNIDRFHGVDFLGEFKWRIKDMDFKVTPELASSQGADQKGNNIHIRTDLSSKKMRIFSLYEKVDPGFEPLFTKKFQLGDLKDRLEIGGTIYPTRFLDVSANWTKRQTPRLDKGKKQTEENLGGKILFSKNLYPAISISLRHRTLDTQDSNSLKRTIKGDLEYQVPKTLLKHISLKSVRIYGVWRRSWENIRQIQGLSLVSEPEKIYDNQYLRVDISPADLVQINAYYRGKSVRAQEIHLGQGSRVINQQQNIYFDATIDRLTGVNMNIRYRGEISSLFPSQITEKHNLSLYRRLESNLRFFPGKWIRILAPFTFEINYQPTWRGYLRDFSNDLNWMQKLWHPVRARALVSSEDNKMFQFRGEWRPSAFLFFYSGLEFYKITSQNLNSQLQTNIKRLNQKLEYRPNMHSLITVQYFRNHEEKFNYSKTIRNNPMIWVENRWNEKLQTKVNLSYLRESKNIGRIREYISTFSPLLGFTYRFLQSGLGASRVEIRNDFSFSFYRSHEQCHNSFSNAFAIDYYPVSVMILRFRLVTTYEDQLNSKKDTISNFLEVRLTAQF